MKDVFSIGARHVPQANTSSYNIEHSKKKTDARITLLNFQTDFHKGILVYDPVEKIQAYVMNPDGTLKLSEFVPPEKSFQLSVKSQLRAFKKAFPSNWYVKISPVEGDGGISFKVYLCQKLKGGVLTDQEKAELEKAKRFDARGWAFYEQRKDTESLSYYKKSLEIRERLIPNSLELAESYHNVGRVYKTQGDRVNALTYLRKAAEIYNNTSPTRDDLRVYPDARWYKSMDKRDKTVEFLHFFGIDESVSSKTLCLNAIYEEIEGLYESQGNQNEALLQYRKSVVIKKKLDGQKELSQGNSKRALSDFCEALVFDELLAPESLSVARLYVDIGRIYQAQSDFEQAAENYQLSIKIYKKLLPKGPEHLALHHILGGIYEILGNFSEALNHYQNKLEIVKELAPNSLELASCYDHLRELCEKYSVNKKEWVNLEEALEIRRKFPPNALELAASYHNSSEYYKLRGQEFEALDFLEKAIKIREKLAPLTLDLAKSYGLVGDIYYSKWNYSKALRAFECELNIRERVAPNALRVAECCKFIGEIYLEQSKRKSSAGFLGQGSIYTDCDELKQALRHFRKSCTILEKEAPNSVQLTKVYDGMAKALKRNGERRRELVYLEKSFKIKMEIVPNSWELVGSCGKLARAYSFLQELSRSDWVRKKEEAVTSFLDGEKALFQGSFEEALRCFNSARAIEEDLVPRSVDVARCYELIGRTYHFQNKFMEEVEQYEKSLGIYNHTCPNGLRTGILYYQVGCICQLQGKLLKALSAFLKAYPILENQLAPNHHSLLLLRNELAIASLKLSDFEVALSFVDKMIEADPKYKYAHDTKGVILKEQGRLEEAACAFDCALNCDPSYADAKIHRLSIIVELARQADDIELIAPAILEARRIQKGDYNTRKKNQLKKIAGGLKEDSEVYLPMEEYQAGSKEYLRGIQQVLAGGKGSSNIQESQVYKAATSSSSVKAVPDVLSGELLVLEDVLQILRSLSDLAEEKLARLSSFSPLFAEVLSEKEKLPEWEKLIRLIDKNQDTRQYFCIFLSEIKAAYLAELNFKDGLLQRRKSEGYAKATRYFSKVEKIVVSLRMRASELISSMTSLVDMNTFIGEKLDFLPLKSFPANGHDFDHIALKLAIECVLEREETLSHLRKNERSSCWREKLSALESGSRDFITEFVKDNNTLAKVLGRLDAYDALGSLIDPFTSEKLLREYERLGFVRTSPGEIFGCVETKSANEERSSEEEGKSAADLKGSSSIPLPRTESLSVVEKKGGPPAQISAFEIEEKMEKKSDKDCVVM